MSITAPQLPITFPHQSPPPQHSSTTPHHPLLPPPQSLTAPHHPSLPSSHFATPHCPSPPFTAPHCPSQPLTTPSPSPKAFSCPGRPFCADRLGRLALSPLGLPIPCPLLCHPQQDPSGTTWSRGCTPWTPYSLGLGTPRKEGTLHPGYLHMGGERGCSF